MRSLRLNNLLLLLLLVSPAAAEEATVNGFRMYYEARGKGEPILFLHGFSLDSRMWEGQQGLARHYQVIVADMRFHGRSGAPENAANDLAEAAADVVGLLDQLKIERAHLVGHSMGGSYALETALRRPDRVRSLTLVAPGIQGVPVPPEALSRFMKSIELYQKQGRSGFYDAWLGDPLFAGVAKKPELRRKIMAMLEAFNMDAILRVRPKPPSPPSQLDRLPEVKVPTLVMIGEADQPHLRSAADRAAQRIPGAKKITYPATNHMINMEQPKKFNRDLEAFVKVH